MQPTGDVGINGLPHPAPIQGGPAARAADPTASLPDDVFGGEDLRSVEQKFTNMRVAGTPTANHIQRGGPDAGLSQLHAVLPL